MAAQLYMKAWGHLLQELDLNLALSDNWLSLDSEGCQMVERLGL